MNSKFRCRGCREYYPAETKIKVQIGSFHSFDCAAEYGRRQAQKRAQKERDERHKELKKKVKREDTQHQHKLTQKAFNRLRVLQELKWFKDRGLEPECISCGKKNMDWCCGHLKTTGAQSSLRYDENNTFLQCNRYCNMALSGNIEGNKNTRGYKKGLIERFGEEEGSAIIEYCESNTKPVKWSGSGSIQLRKKCNSKIRELEDGKAIHKS